MWSVWHDWVRVMLCDGQSLNIRWSQAELRGKAQILISGTKEVQNILGFKGNLSYTEMYMFIYSQSRAVRIRRSVCKPQLLISGFSWWFGFIILTLDAILCRCCKPWFGASCSCSLLKLQVLVQHKKVIIIYMFIHWIRFNSQQSWYKTLLTT